jgi:hypothetical protein
LIPTGFELLRDDSTPEGRAIVVRGTVEDWAEADFGPGAMAEELSLEDIFLAFAASTRVRL